MGIQQAQVIGLIKIKVKSNNCAEIGLTIKLSF